MVMGITADYIHKKNLVVACSVAVFICFAHSMASVPLVGLGLVAFAVLVLSSKVEVFLPVMLFFLPWSLLIRPTADSFSLCTIVTFLYSLKYIAVKRWDIVVPKKPVLLGMILVAMVLFAKMFCGEPALTTSFIMFLFMLVFFPIYLANEANRLSFKECVAFFSVGVILSCVMSLALAENSNMSEYITVANTDVVNATRACGFVGDGNGFAAQILAALACVLSFQYVYPKNKIFYLLVAFGLFACGLMTVSKMFLIVSVIVFAIWFVGTLSKPDAVIRNIVIFAVSGAVLTAVVASGVFDYQIDIYVRRFMLADNSVSDLTTGRSDIWAAYLQYIGSDFFRLLFGDGFGERYLYVSAVARDVSPHNTIIEVIYRFGLIGFGLCIGWFVTTIMEVIGKPRKLKANAVCACLLMIGCFAPWLALAMLTFDDFFYIPALFALGCVYSKEKCSAALIEKA